MPGPPPEPILPAVPEKRAGPLATSYLQLPQLPEGQRKSIHLVWHRPGEKLWTLLCLINAAMCARVKQHSHSWIPSFIYFRPSPPLPPPTLLFHPSPGSSQHGENSSDHPIPASALQPAVQGPDSEWQWWGHYCHHQVSCGTTTSTTGFISGWEPSGCG